MDAYKARRAAGEREPFTPQQLQEALQYQKQHGGKLGYNLVKLGFVKDEEITQLLSRQYGVPSINLARFEIDPSVIKLVPAETAQKYQIIPLSRAGANLTIAMVDPTNVFAMDDIKFMTGYNVEPVVASETAIMESIEKYYGSVHSLQIKEEMDKLVETDEFGDDVEVLEEGDEIDLQELERSSEEAPVVKLCNLILTDALRRGASDIHIEPYEREFRVRFRIDGVLYVVMNPPMKLRDAMISRLKIMAKLDISEKRLPQDGRIKIRMNNQGKMRELDYRVSTLPTLWGEKVVLRLLDKENLMLDMTKLGFEVESLKYFEEAIFKPWGMVLVTGPTGSGKTNTLYSAISQLNTPETNIMTAEDPVEFNLAGVNQVQMKESIGLNFAAALRSFLRQDPNIVLVGEIRDGGNRGQGRANRSFGLVDAPHERRAIDGQPSDEHGDRALPRRNFRAPDRCPASRSAHLQRVQGPDGSAGPGAHRCRLHTGRCEGHSAAEGPRLRHLQQHGLQRAGRSLRGLSALG